MVPSWKACGIRGRLPEILLVWRKWLIDDDAISPILTSASKTIGWVLVDNQSLQSAQRVRRGEGRMRWEGAPDRPPKQRLLRVEEESWRRQLRHRERRTELASEIGCDNRSKRKAGIPVGTGWETVASAFAATFATWDSQIWGKCKCCGLRTAWKQCSSRLHSSKWIFPKEFVPWKFHRPEMLLIHAWMPSVPYI